MEDYIVMSCEIIITTCQSSVSSSSEYSETSKQSTWNINANVIVIVVRKTHQQHFLDVNCSLLWFNTVILDHLLNKTTLYKNDKRLCLILVLLYSNAKKNNCLQLIADCSSPNELCLFRGLIRMNKLGPCWYLSRSRLAP